MKCKICGNAEIEWCDTYCQNCWEDYCEKEYVKYIKSINNSGVFMDIRIKKLNKNAVIPSYAKDGDAGLDLTITSKQYLDNEHIKYGFGIALEIPEGYVGLVFPRSSIYKKRQILSNCVGVIDSGYRGEISAVMLGTSRSSYEVGDRACQLIIFPYPKIEFIECDNLTETERGVGGYGSTGN